jgi:hypothetical protein
VRRLPQPPLAAEPGRGRGHLWLFLPAAALAALWLSWRALAAVDFLYPVLYEGLDIRAHVLQFAPQNRYKQGFETTTRNEHVRLFRAIVDAIHDSGRGLAELEYRDALGRPIDRLLREPEITHLEDVARLIDRLVPIGWLAVAWTAMQLALLRWLGWAVPSLARLLGASVLAALGATALVLVIGPRRVFYWLHDLVFPPENPWFFYYQDSLMTTMMKAPDLFGAIAAVLLALALGIYGGLLWLAWRLALHAE